MEEPGASGPLQVTVSIAHTQWFAQDTYHEVKDGHAQERQGDDAERSPKPVGAIGGEVVVGGGRVEVERVVAHDDRKATSWLKLEASKGWLY